MPVIQTITASTGGAAGSVTSVAMSVPTGFVVTGSPITTSGTLAVSFASGYSLPTTASQSNWDSAYTFTSTFPTGTALQLLRYNSAGTALEFFTANFLSNPFSALGDTLYSNAAGAPLRLAGNTTATLKFLSQTGDGFGSSAAPIWLEITPTTIGAVPTSRTITINGTTLDLSANRSWSVGTVTSIGLSSTTSGITIGSTPVTSSGTITIDIATATSTSNGLLSSSDWSYFDAKMGNPFTTLGDIVYSNAIGIPLRKAGNITTTKMFLSQTGDGTSSAAPQWSVVTAADTGAVPTSRQLTINGTAYDLTADRSWSVGTITSLTGEATGSGTGAVSVTLTNSAVIGKVLTGLSISGGTIASTDSILTAFGKLQNQVNGLVGGVMYQGTWNASTNTPALSSSTGTKGHYYVVSVAGSTNLDGITDWKLGDWAIFNGSTWEKVDNTDAVTSVNGYTGAVVLTTSDVAEGTNLYYTDTRARLAISETITGIDYNNSTGVFSTTTGYGIPTTAKQTEWDTAYTNRITSLTTTGSSGAATLISNTLNIPNYTAAGLGAVPTSRTITINDVVFDLTADRSWSVGDFGTW